ncbi:hypothetical protein [Propionimicrobium lymphophilum]|uniref:hypothetical protein n=1 Tax=Propionimicrobium lymphophilum TaxID=33012 RepID=UPI00288AEF72|nr:hypothetical protein [Propionimicrobium lymphophilum]
MFYYRKALPSALLVTLIVIISQVLTTLANMPANINRHLIFCAALDVIIFLTCFFLFRLRPQTEKKDATTLELKDPEL